MQYCNILSTYFLNTILVIYMLRKAYNGNVTPNVRITFCVMFEEKTSMENVFLHKYFHRVEDII